MGLEGDDPRQLGEPAKLLDGVRVVDLTRFVSGPYCTMVLAELGADVIKIENPSGGDGTRRWAPDRQGTQGPDNPYFMSINRSKKSVAIDLRSAEGAQLLARLIKAGDVIIHNFRQDSARRLGIAYDDVRKIKPDIIYCEVSGYGNRGPKAERRAMDFIIQAETGIMRLIGDVDDPPYKVTFPIVDLFAANIAAAGILAALVRRSRTGEGAKLSTSLLEAGLASMTNICSEYLVGGIEPEKMGSRHQDLAPYEVHSSSDSFIAVGVATEAQWQKFCAVAGLEHLREDPRFATNPVRAVHRRELDEAINPVLASRTTEDWVHSMAAAGIPCAPVALVPEALADEQVAAMGIVQSGNHPIHGEIRYVRTPLSVDGIPVTAPRMAPTLGCDTRSVLTSLAGLAADELRSLEERGVIALGEEHVSL